MRLMDKYRSGSKLTWNEQFIWIPVIRFAAKIIVLLIVGGFISLISLLVIKFIKFLWYV